MIYTVRGTKDATRESRQIDADSAKRAAEIYEYQIAGKEHPVQLTVTDEHGNETRWIVFETSTPQYESFHIDDVLAGLLGGG